VKCLITPWIEDTIDVQSKPNISQNSFFIPPSLHYSDM